MKTEVETRIAIERKIVRYMLRLLLQNSWICCMVNNGDEIIRVESNSEAIEHIFSVDESWVVFKKGDFTKVVSVVLGNDGFDCICDHSCSDEYNEEDDFEGLMDVVSTYSEQFQ